MDVVVIISKKLNSYLEEKGVYDQAMKYAKTRPFHPWEIKFLAGLFVFNQTSEGSHFWEKLSDEQPV